MSKACSGNMPVWRRVLFVGRDVVAKEKHTRGFLSPLPEEGGGERSARPLWRSSMFFSVRRLSRVDAENPIDAF